MRQLGDCLIFIMGIPTPVRQHLNTVPWNSHLWHNHHPSLFHGGQGPISQWIIYYELTLEILCFSALVKILMIQSCHNFVNFSSAVMASAKLWHNLITIFHIRTIFFTIFTRFELSALKAFAKSVLEHHPPPPPSSQLISWRHEHTSVSHCARTASARVKWFRL